jgi:hypothetical protein
VSRRFNSAARQDSECLLRSTAIGNSTVRLWPIVLLNDFYGPGNRLFPPQTTKFYSAKFGRVWKPVVLTHSRHGPTAGMRRTDTRLPMGVVARLCEPSSSW